VQTFTSTGLHSMQSGTVVLHAAHVSRAIIPYPLIHEEHANACQPQTLQYGR
jgi:hypothetical protein